MRKARASKGSNMEREWRRTRRRGRKMEGRK